jgi:alpha-1,2-glucosyltransferase
MGINMTSIGHKEFHSASLHLPQMLYIWPYFMFFSWPVLIIPRVIKLTRSIVRKSASITVLMEPMPRIGITLAFVSLMLVTVHMNTIVHPFILADNRHYVFYVFRILLRHPAIKYLATPIYFVCGWAVLTAFGQPYITELHTPGNSDVTIQISNSTINPDPARRASTTSSGSNNSQLPQIRQVKVSFVLVWLACTTLSLITAPLVEPRYFIIPWVIWRMHIPSSDPSPRLRSAQQDEKPAGGERSGFIRYLPLLVESIWFILINVITGYVFLYRGFEWPQEPGLVQRFLW